MPCWGLGFTPSMWRQCAALLWVFTATLASVSPSREGRAVFSTRSKEKTLAVVLNGTKATAIVRADLLQWTKSVALSKPLKLEPWDPTRDWVVIRAISRCRDRQSGVTQAMDRHFPLVLCRGTPSQCGELRVSANFPSAHVAVLELADFREYDDEEEKGNDPKEEPTTTIMLRRSAVLAHEPGGMWSMSKETSNPFHWLRRLTQKRECVG